jgi:hypothetical protein
MSESAPVAFPPAKRFASRAADAAAAPPPASAAIRAAATAGSSRQSKAFFVSMGGTSRSGTISGNGSGGTNEEAMRSSPARIAAVTLSATSGASALFAALAAADSAEDLRSGTSALSTFAPEPLKSRSAIRTRAEHAVTSAEDGSEAFAPPGDNATVIATSESLTRAASRPESDIERISHRPEHAHAAPFTSRDAVTELTLVSLRSEPTSNDPHDRSVSATESPPCFRTWSGMSTRRFPSQSRSQSSAERACATAPHARAHHTTATRTTRTDAGTPIFAAGLRARRAVCVSARLEKSESGASWQVEKP